MNSDVIFHYPADLMNLLIEAVHYLNKGKQGVFLFFRGAGISEALMAPAISQWEKDKESISKRDIARQVLTAINEHGDAYLRPLLSG